MLAAGKYVVSAKGILNSNDTGITAHVCSLVVGASRDGQGSEPTRLGPNGELDRQYLALTVLADLPAGGTANLICRTSGSQANIIEPRITAIKVGAVTTISGASRPQQGATGSDN